MPLKLCECRPSVTCWRRGRSYRSRRATQRSESLPRSPALKVGAAQSICWGRMLAVALFFLLNAFMLPAQEPVHGRVIATTDGDTLRVLTADNQQIRIRLAFIDAP